MEKVNYVLTNVRLETGFKRNGNLVIGTETDFFDMHIENGKITAVEKKGTFAEKSSAGTEIIDAGGDLCVPSFREMHSHPDKTFLGGSWKAPFGGGIEDLINNELEYMRTVDSSVMKERAANLITAFENSGAVFVRAHADVQDEIGLKSVYAIKEVLEKREMLNGFDLVAFPQKGLLSKTAGKYMREAVQNGANIVGGIDPSEIEGNRDKALEALVDIAVNNNVGIDMHCHEHGSEGIKSIEKLAKMTIDAGLQGKVAVSHAFALGSAPEKEVEAATELLAEAGVSVITSVLIADPMPNIPNLLKKGVKVHLGADNIFDSWSPFGIGDICHILTRACLKFELFDEYSLSRALKLITNGLTPLDDNGKRVWPNVGDDANFVFAEAVCTAEMIGRDRAKTMIISNNNILIKQTAKYG